MSDAPLTTANAETVAATEPTPKLRTRRTSKKAAATVAASGVALMDADGDSTAEPAPKKRLRATSKKSAISAPDSPASEAPVPKEAVVDPPADKPVRKTPVRRKKAEAQAPDAKAQQVPVTPVAEPASEKIGQPQKSQSRSPIKASDSADSEATPGAGPESSDASVSTPSASTAPGAGAPRPSSHGGQHPTRAEKEFRRGSRRFRSRRQRLRERRQQGDGGHYTPEHQGQHSQSEKPSYEREPREQLEQREPREEFPPDDGPPVFAEGILELSGKGFGFLRDMSVNFDFDSTEIFVTPEVVRTFGLREGMHIRGQTRRAPKGPQLFRLTEIEGEPPEKFRNLPVFEELTVLNPLERIRLETTPERLTTRVIDLMAPIGKGTRGLLVAPPRTGKTTILQHIAEAVLRNHPQIKVILLLVDERPEEVTELRRSLPQAEVMASSNDSDIKSHTRIAQLAIDRARRLVEMGRDVFVLMDSLTRIGRAFNNAQSGKGRTMSGGVDSRALEIPRKIFAAARNTEEAGSLTIVATALIETGSRMDDLIFLEFKGTGNMELVLDRGISDQRIYPAADIFQSGTRREELLLSADALHKINIIRRGLSGHKPIEAIERLLFFLRKHPTNAEMLTNIPG